MATKKVNGVYHVSNQQGNDPDAIKFTEQDLTSEEKAQARENIGAAADDIPAVKYVAQTLTDAQKAQARTNINAPSVADLNAIGNGSYVESWDGASTPVVADIPAGVVVTYNTTDYTGTLAASASTVGKIYLVSTGTAGNYDRYITEVSGSTYSWTQIGTTAIDLSDYATKEEVSQLSQELTENLGGDYAGYIVPTDNYIDGRVWALYIGGYKGFLVPVIPGQQLKITAGERTSVYTFVQEQNIVNGATVIFADGYSGKIGINPGESSGIVTTPSNAAYLWVLTTNYGEDHRPASLILYTALASKGEVTEITKELIPFIGGDYIEYVGNSVNYIDGTVWNTTAAGYNGYLIPVVTGQKVKIASQETRGTVYAFIQEQNIVNGQQVLFADGYNSKINVSENSETEILTVPNNCAYLWVLTMYANIDYKPSHVIFYPPFSDSNGIIERNITKDAAFRSTGIKARDTDIKPLSFLHISDIHTRATDYKCFVNACKFLEHYDNIKFGIITGDLIYDTFADPMTYYNEGLAETTKPVLNVIGNHDAGQYNASQGGLSTVGTDAQVYAKYIEPYISGWGLKTDGSGTPHPDGKSYYFTDFTDERIRLIVLCEFESDMELDPNDPTKYKYSREYRSMRQAQVDWFINSLATTPSGYGVVVAWHQPNELKSEDNPFVSDAVVNTTATAYIYTSSQNRGWLLRIIDAFQNKEALSFSFEQTGGVVGTINVSCDFTSAVGNFICVLAGHVHNDYVGHFEQYPGIPVLTVGADNITWTGKYCQRALGTPSEDLFNVVNIDQTRRKITIIRVGADSSITGQDRRRLQVSY